MSEDIAMTYRSRRDFLRRSSLAAAGPAMALLALGDDHKPGGAAPGHHGEALARRAATIRSVKSGDWSDLTTWGGRIPKAEDLPLIEKEHVVRVEAELTTSRGVHVAEGGTLEFAPDRSTTFESTANVIIEGTLRMRPSAPQHVQTLRFRDVDERRFVGGGMDPLDSDVGLWVIGVGALDLLGGAKTAWTRAAGSVPTGETVVEVISASGWRTGDTIVIVPTDTPTDGRVGWNDKANAPTDPFAAKFERRTITAVDGNRVTLDAPLAHDHLAVATDTGKRWTAEVANLTRNARIEGTTKGRAHIFIRSSVPQSIRNIEGRYLGPRTKQPGKNRPQLVQGRYALHFHHCFEGSRKTVVEGCAIYDTGNRVYVPHLSHGITMRGNVSFSSMETAFWWDFQESTHDTLWDGNLAALSLPNGVDSSSMAMSLGQGDGNIARNNVVVYGHHGDPHGHGGYVWDANNEGVWIFENNLSHSNRTGLFVWQNTGLNHTIVNHESYNDYLAIFHGAYANSYTYTGGYVYGGIVRVKATSGNTSGVRFEKMSFEGGSGSEACVEIYPSPATSGVDSNVFRECIFRSSPVAVLMNTFPIGNENTRKHVDLILCEFIKITKNVGFTKESTPDSWFRIQPERGQCTKMVHATGEERIEPFAPYQYGTGSGLTGRYYVGSRFDKLVVTRVDPVINFEQWSYDKGASPHGVHHLVDRDEYSVRWIGQVGPHFTQPHTFRVKGAAGFRLWVDGKLVIDSWTERADNTNIVESSPIQLTAGRKCDLRLETFNAGGARGCQLYWECEGLGRMVHILQSQLYPDLPK